MQTVPDTITSSAAICRRSFPRAELIEKDKKPIKVIEVCWWCQVDDSNERRELNKLSKMVIEKSCEEGRIQTVSTRFKTFQLRPST